VKEFEDLELKPCSWKNGFIILWPWKPGQGYIMLNLLVFNMNMYIMVSSERI